LNCGAEIRLGGLCVDDASAIATAEDITAEQIVSETLENPASWLIDQWGATHAMPANALVGRSQADCYLGILHHTVSSVHARLHRDDEGWLLSDLDSLNGTFLNGTRIDQARVRKGDRVGFGDVSLYFADDLEGTRDRVAGPGRTKPSKQRDVAFSGRLRHEGRAIELLERPGGGIVQDADGTLLVEFARLEFALLAALFERRRDARVAELAYLSSRELADRLAFRSRDADSDNVRDLIRRVRKKFQNVGIEDLIDSRQGVGYRITWSASE
jgi:hypothetical protein